MNLDINITDFRYEYDFRYKLEIIVLNTIMSISPLQKMWGEN